MHPGNLIVMLSNTYLVCGQANETMWLSSDVQLARTVAKPKIFVVLLLSGQVELNELCNRWKACRDRLRIRSPRRNRGNCPTCTCPPGSLLEDMTHCFLLMIPLEFLSWLLTLAHLVTLNISLTALFLAFVLCAPCPYRELLLIEKWVEDLKRLLWSFKG